MLNIKNHGFCLVILFFLTKPLFADTSIDASIRLLYFNYEEFDQSGASFNKETGIIPGFSIGVSHRQGNYDNTLSFEAYDGQVDYDGQTQSGAPHITNTDETLNRLFYKLNWSPDSSEHAIYGKIAWQRWDRDILPANNISGLFEQYEWWAFEIGFLATLYEKNTNQWLLEFGLSKISNGTIAIDLIDHGYGQPELELGDGHGITAALIYQHMISDRNRLGLSLRHQRWTFGRSNTKSISNGFTTINITEPESESNHSIFSINYSYYF